MHDFLSSFLSSNEMSNIISVLALLVALYSVWYTRRFNRPRIVIEDADSDGAFDHPLIEFKILNISNTPIVIRSIIFSIDGRTIFPINDYEGPEESVYDPVLDAEPLMLEGETTMLPNSEDEYRYYFKDIGNEVTITVETNRMLSIFSKSKSFVLRTDE